MPLFRADDHSVLESDVAAYLDGLGFLRAEATYHSTLEENIVRRLQVQRNMTALYVRGRADRLAIHPTLDLCFEWEAKTHPAGNKWPDMTFELLPFLHHAHKCELGVCCLYAYRDPRPERKDVGDRGFWVEHAPAIRDIRFTDRCPAESLPLASSESKRRWPNARHYPNGPSSGTGDPYVIIGYPTVVTLPDWRDLLDHVFADGSMLAVLGARQPEIARPRTGTLFDVRRNR